MDSKLHLVEKLIAELESFNFENFSSDLKISEYTEELLAANDTPE